MQRIKVGAVSYLNTKPLIYGFENGLMEDVVELVNDYPARIAGMLLNNEIDVGLVPVAIIPKLLQAHVITDCCIGCHGAVASVCLFSDVPIEQVTHVLLDYQSRTSVRLAKILLKEYWQLQPQLTDAKEDFRDHIKGTTAGLVIGDRAFEQRTISPYMYDLGDAWLKHTGLPFVFAAWVSNKKLPAGFIERFNDANHVGLNNLDKVIAAIRSPLFDMQTYYTQYINYQLDEEKKKGLQLFLNKLQVLEQV